MLCQECTPTTVVKLRQLYCAWMNTMQNPRAEREKQNPRWWGFRTMRGRGGGRGGKQNQPWRVLHPKLTPCVMQNKQKTNKKSQKSSRLCRKYSDVDFAYNAFGLQEGRTTFFSLFFFFNEETVKLLLLLLYAADTAAVAVALRRGVHPPLGVFCA